MRRGEILRHGAGDFWRMGNAIGGNTGRPWQYLRCNRPVQCPRNTQLRSPAVVVVVGVGGRTACGFGIADIDIRLSIWEGRRRSLSENGWLISHSGRRFGFLFSAVPKNDWPKATRDALHFPFGRSQF